MGGVIRDRATLLAQYLREMRARPLRPGHHDCALFAAGWVERCTGVDLARDWRGRYGTLEAGKALLAKTGIADHVAMAARCLPEIENRAAARVGDVAAVTEGDQTGLGIVGGRFVHVAGMCGLDVVPLARAIRVFRP